MKYDKLETFKYVTNKILPSVYDDSLSYSELLARVISYLNDTITNVDEFKNFIDDFVETFDEKLQETVRNDISELEKNGFLGLLIKEFINKKSVEIDNTLEKVTGQLEQKADKTYVDTLTQSLASGSPKGTYTTLTDLQKAYPTGNTNIYVVTADGNWYYWNGTAWTPGGIYQSTGVIDITPEQTTFIEKNISKNRFDKTSVVVNHMYSVGNLITVDPSYGYGALLIEDIDGINNITFSSPDITSDSAKLYNACFFDKNDNFISELIVQKFIKKSNPITIEIPVNAYSVGVSIANYVYVSDKKYMAEDGTTASTYEDYQPPYYTFMDSIITGSAAEVQIKLPPIIPALVGKEINVYFDNIILADNLTDYKIDVVCDIGNHQNERWTAVPSTTGTYPLSISVYKNGNMITSGTSSVVVKSISVGSGVTKKALFIGDSTTDAGEYTNELVSGLFSSDVMNLELLGTRGSLPNLHEGRGGWRAYNYVNDASLSEITNAFWNPSTSTFDFSYYMTQQGYDSVDVVGIHLGINDMFNYKDDDSVRTEIINVLNRFDTMLNSIKEYNTNTKVAFLVTIPPSKNQDAFGKNYGSDQTQWRYKRNNFLFVESLIDKYKNREVEGIYLVPVNVNLDTENNMMTETVHVNSRNTETVVRQSNGVHPHPTGYKQMADVIYYWLKSFEI